VTCGLIAALRRRGLIVQSFKCGPDYIDPSYHELAAGRPSRNLDTWMLSDTQLLESFARACQGADIAVVEGVMGLFDGSDWLAEHGSSAQIAKLLQAAVVLVIDISGMARSAAAVVGGYRAFDPEVALRAVVLNFAGSERHARGCAEAIAHSTGLPMLGWLPRELELQIPERHLGLVPGAEQPAAAALIAEMAAAVDERFDLDRVLELASGEVSTDQILSRPVETPRVSTPATPKRSRAPVVAVARDAAFCFYYPENLELLVDAGAAVEFFSPLRGELPSRAAAGIYLGGGYPELHGDKLAANTGMWHMIQDLDSLGVPIYAECGGLMVLTEALTDMQGNRWPMAGLLPGSARMSGKLVALGYRHATALRANLLVEQGEALRGHEFRYSSWVGDSSMTRDMAAWEVGKVRVDTPPEWMGFTRGNLLASYLHVHFGQRRDLARRFVERLR
jgi:cobyrinic acid a,c-diamide synthase